MFKITITEFRNTTRTERQWLKMKDNPSPGESNYGYAPPVEVAVTKELEVLSQAVEELDLISVIKAINKIE